MTHGIPHVNANDGVHCEDSNIVWNDTATASGNGGNGVSFSGSQVTMRNITCDSSALTGFVAINGSTCKADDLTMTNSGDNGVALML